LSKVRVDLAGVALGLRGLAVRLARWARVDGVELVAVLGQELQRASRVELERVVAADLRLKVHADHLEPGAVVAHRRAAGAAEQVEQAGPHDAPP
jgi:hypothetical protein